MADKNGGARFDITNIISTVLMVPNSPMMLRGLGGRLKAQLR